MGGGGGAAEGELKGLLQEKTTEDHEVVSVAVLRLHYLGSVDAGFVHECYVFGLADGDIRVCRDQLRQVTTSKTWNGHTVILQLLEPHGMNEIALLVIRCLLSQCCFGQSLLLGRVLLAQGE